MVIGDGLAWKCLGHDRAAITILGRGERVAWLSDGAGWEAEASALEHQHRAGHFALLNDLTTCLRHGDITVIEPERRAIYEVKAGGLAPDDSAQMTRLREAVDFVNTGVTEIDGEEGGFIRCTQRYRTHLAQVPSLLRRAQEQGSASATVSPCQFVVVHDMRFFRSETDLPKLASADAARDATGWPKSDVILDSSTTIRRMRDRHHSFATLAPISIYPFPADQVCDLLHGWLNVSTLVNVSLLARSLARHGIAAEAIAPPASEEAFLRVLKRTGPGTGVEGTVAAHQREMMMLELMTPVTLRAGIDALVDHVAAGTSDPQRQMVFWADEASTWNRGAN
jgi:hypothetical protein